MVNFLKVKYNKNYMAGHSKWANIKRKKEAEDKKRGKIFSKISRMITLAVLAGGGITDPDKNVKLRLAVEKAKEANMPKENIIRAIDRAKKPESSTLKEVIYEAFGPSGTALMIEGSSDNPNRTLSEVRNVLSRFGGKLATPGSVSHLFKRCGLLIIKKEKINEEKIFEIGESLLAFDIDQDSEAFYVYFPFENLGKVKELLSPIQPDAVEIDYKPSTLIKISDQQTGKTILDLIESLENLDDIQKVYFNCDISL